MSATIRHLLSRQESSLPIKLIAHIQFTVFIINIHVYIQPTEFESVHIVWKTNGLPLTYSCLYHT